MNLKLFSPHFQDTQIGGCSYLPTDTTGSPVEPWATPTKELLSLSNLTKSAYVTDNVAFSPVYSVRHGLTDNFHYYQGVWQTETTRYLPRDAPLGLENFAILGS